MAMDSDFTDGASAGIAACIMLAALSGAPQIAASAKWLWATLAAAARKFEKGVDRTRH